jgi:hypothetical protein
MIWTEDQTEYSEHAEAFGNDDIAKYPEPAFEKIVEAVNESDARMIGHGYAFLHDYTAEGTWSRVHRFVSNVP